MGFAKEGKKKGDVQNPRFVFNLLLSIHVYRIISCEVEILW